ncbi:Transcription initiation factor TFIID subunit 5 [Entomophthora muscae]|uniref:Transcription initiation factor TFIID subunit 5 n=1 Tax=Entomophthora muscae TaxID=34485 RepID=A0ACC2UER0_9FUNG|nr:Transcription initiation factor TFIID subunit 5 [Entomophthora muscae]
MTSPPSTHNQENIALAEASFNTNENTTLEDTSLTMDPVDFNVTDSPTFERVIYTYLTKKGFMETIPKFVAEAKEIQGSLLESNSYSRLDASVLELLLEGERTFEPDTYLSGYSKLRSWINDSLDLYKPELLAFLFPLFVHSYLDLVSKNSIEKAFNFFALNCEDHSALHNEDVKALTSIKAPQHVKENELAQLFRNNKYTIKMSRVGFELFISYLQDSQLMTILRLVNDHFAMQETRHSGPPPLPSDAKSELELLLKEEDSMQKRKKAKDENATFTSLLESYKKYSATKYASGYARDEIPLPPVKGTDILRSIQEFKEIADQVKLVDGSSASASICFYTFHNTLGSLNAVSISEDLKFLAGGFSDSYIKLWSLRGDSLRSLKGNFNPTMVNDEGDLERMRKVSGSDTKRLVGHSGPVYGLSFSSDSKHLISCSEDSTVRLWNMDSFTNLVCYKGHNYPVWDVDFAPLGVYFASASHDRTARLWSCEHISPLRIFTGHLSDVDVVRFHPNSRYIVTGSSDKTARMWDIQKGACVRVFTGHQSAVYTLAISPDGRQLATAGFDGLINLWDIGSGHMIDSFKPSEKSGATYTLVFSNDSKVLISGGADKVVQLWDVTKKESTKSSSTARNQDSPSNEADRVPGLLASYHTKETSITYLKCTPRNLILGAGCFSPHLK